MRKDTTLGSKKRKSLKHPDSPMMRPPLTLEAETAFYALEEERGVYDEFWRNMGYSIEHGLDFPPYERGQKRPNNRSSSWNGTFAFTFVFLQADAPTQKALLHALTNDYQCELSEGGMQGQWEGQARLNGKRVKNLTRLLNRQYAHGYLVWKEW
jgi:hypothetical protein